MGELEHLVSGGCLRSISVTCFQWALSSSAFWITNTPFIVAVTRSLLALGTLPRHCLSYSYGEALRIWDVKADAVHLGSGPRCLAVPRAGLNRLSQR
jgi:hypothetical protein